ncbi:unnamed protein product [Owenia fusiformis]|uniref:NF-kappa-B-repressing factor n=1 Tax=Owenia fusiformis TaxID=6347 RepID=A0A8S4P443_OWEFU|nr:unnamed protein product [Owenia fusiformis]
MSKGIRVDPQYYSTQSYMRKGQKNLPNNEHFTPDPSHQAKIAPVSTNPPTIDDAYDDAYGYDLNEPYEYENKVEEYNAHQGFLEKGFDVEELRMEHETANEWMMRRKFIDAHRFNFPKDRLICLSSCFVNIEKYGARYPQQVMDDIKRLTQGMTEELNKHKQKAKDYTMTNFVRSSGTENKKEDPSQALKRKSAEGAAYAAKKSKMLFVKAAGEFQSTDVTHANEILSGDADEIFNNMSASKERMKDAKETYTGNPMSDPGAIKVLCYKFLRLSKKLNSFTDKSKNAVEHIHNACARTHMQHRADIRHSWESLPICFVCEVYINEVLVGVGRGQKKKDAKHNGYANALVTIKKKFLIVYKNEKPTHGRLELRSSDDPFDNAVFINKRDIMETIEPPKPPTPPPSEESEPTPVPEPSKPTQEDPKKLKPTKKQPLPAKEFVTPPLNPDPAMQTKDLPVINPNPFQDPSLPAPDIMYTKKPAIKIAAKFKSASLVPQPKKQEDTRPLTVQWRDRANNHSNPKIANFVIKEPMEAEDGSAEPLGVLVNSISAAPQCDGNFSVKPGQDGHVGVFSLGGEVIAVGKGATPKDAKRKSAELAMPLLKQWCWTLKTGKPQTDGDKVSKESIGDLSATEGTSGANGNLGSQIEGDNIGNRMLQKIGWTGGGLGKKETGRVQPVSLESVINREGLGYTGDVTNLKQTVKKHVENYIKSGKTGEMAFSADFTSEERKIIHNEARKLGLKSQSYNTKIGRFLVVSRKRNLIQTIEYALTNEEASDKYKVIPPTGNIF